MYGTMQYMLGELPSDLILLSFQIIMTGFQKSNNFQKKNNFLISRQEYIEELEKWSSPPSYNAVIEHDNHVTHDDIDNGNDDHITIDMIQSDGLPSYDDACRISNINNNYI